MQELITWGSAAAAISALLAILKFWIDFSDRIAKVETMAAEKVAKAEAVAAEKIAILTAQFSMYREQIAREYVQRETLREVEERHRIAMRETERRLTDAIEKLGERFDRQHG